MIGEPIDKMISWLSEVIGHAEQVADEPTATEYARRQASYAVPVLARARACAEDLKKAADAEKAKIKPPEEVSLRDRLAAQEVLEPAEDWQPEIMDALAGPRPAGDWKTNPLEWLAWEARWRAAVRYMRADAMIEESKQPRRLPEPETETKPE